MTDLRKEIIERIYDEEMKNHLGFAKGASRPGNCDNYRNGSYEKTVKTSSGEIELSVPRDRNGEFEPKIAKKHQSDIFGIEDRIISLYGCGMSTRDISDNIRELYEFDVSAETVPNITNRVLSEVKEWQSRPLKSTYAVIFMDGRKEVLSLHIGGAESSK